MTEPWIDDGRRRAAFRRRLLAWYDEHKRDLPWRRQQDPYAVWLSEVMLQQTRVETARGYFERFLQRFPTVTDLALADESQVLKMWEGLGYYSRARNLHRAAQAVVEHHDGRLPATYDALLGLPGVGPYTAAAVSSIAFDAPHPAIDGNVVRVMSRVLRLEEDPRRASTRAAILRAGQQLMPDVSTASAGDWNQAMMELGARVCVPSSPRCEDCPVSRWCRARQELPDPSVLPVRAPRAQRPHLQVTAAIIRHNGKLLIAQRPDGGMLAGLWEFPGGKQEPGETLEACLRREIEEELGIVIDVEECVASVDHEYTHLSITLHAFSARYRSGQTQALECAAFEWIDIERLHDYTLPRADHKVLEAMSASGTELKDLIART